MQIKPLLLLLLLLLQTDFQLPFGDDGQTVREERDGGRED
jgi:hypothetical protein